MSNEGIENDLLGAIHEICGGDDVVFAPEISGYRDLCADR